MNIARSLLLLALLAATSLAGRYPAAGTQSFSYPDNTTNLGDGTTLSSSFLGSFAKVTGNATTDATKPYLQLSNKSFSGNTAAWRIPDLDPGIEVQSFDASLIVRMQRTTTGAPGAGWTLSFGAIPATGNGSGDLGFAMTNGIVISFDTFKDNASDTPSIDVLCNGTSVGNFPTTALTELPVITAGNFTLTNPATGGTTAALQYNASASTVQSSMRAVSGWSTVTVTGTAGNWTVNRGATGSYADPTGNGANLTGPTMTPGLAEIVVTNTQDGGAAQNEIWTIQTQGRGFVFDTNFRTLSIHWDYDGLDLTYGGQLVFADLPTPGFVPAAGNKFAFTASCVGGAQDTFVDELVLSTGPLSPFDTGGPIITEFLAENGGSLEDDYVESSDWVEIYNGQNSVAALGGWKLTDGTTTWVFPAMNMAAYEYRVIFASGRNRTNPASWLHTNFAIGKDGGTLSLLRPDNSVATTFNYGQQFSNVSYGEKGPSRTVGYLLVPSPGAKVNYADPQAPAGKAEDVVWSREGGIITAATPLSITAPVAAGAVVRYTLDNSTPNSASPVYTTPFNITASTNVRARVFTPGRLPGDTSSRTFLLIDASLANYNGSGQPFSSNVPVIVFDSFGVNVDNENGTSRPLRYTYGVVIDKNPLTGRATLTGLSDFTGRGGTHVHGESSAGFPQRSYNWETWDNEDNDKDVGILGMPAHSDWILHGPWSDESLMRNHLTYSLMRAMRPDYLASRSRQVEVFFNQEAGQPVSYADYRGVYTVLEKVTRGKNRADVEKLNDKVTDPTLLSGGYIFKRDKVDAGATTWTTSAPSSIGMQSHYPEVYTTPQFNALSGYINSFQAVLNGANFADPVTGYAAWIDVSSFIDGQLAVELTKQIDGYVFSTYWHKPRAGKIKAGQIWDFNIALGNADYAEGQRADGWNYDATGANSGGVGQLWYPRLHADPLYRRATFDRYWAWRRSELTNTAWSARVEAEVAALCDGGSASTATNTSALSIQSPAARHFRKYQTLGAYQWPNAPGSTARTNYRHEIDYMKNWMLTRLAWLDDQYRSGSVVLRPPNFSVSPGNVAAGTSLTITRYTGTPPAGTSYATGTIYYTTDGSDPAATGTGPAETTLINGTSATCKWLVPSAGNAGFSLTAGAGAQQWTNYTDPPNIANWTSGNTGVGYDNNPDYLPLISSNTGPQMFNVNATCYVRVAFNIPDQATLDAIGVLKLGMKYDDGFRAFINGTLVAGRNDTDPTMVSDPSTAVASAVRTDEGQAVQFEDIDITTAAVPSLRIGANVLAIHCLNLPAGSSDLLMVPKLTYLPPGGGATGGGIAYSGPLTLNTTTTVRARLLTSLGAWTPENIATYTVNTIPASAANLVISEFMYNPSNPTPAETSAGHIQSSDFEFLELENISAQTLNLTNVRFTEGINFNFNDGDPTARALPPGGRVLIVGKTTAYLSRHGAPPSSVKIAGVWQGSLNNGGEQLRLLDGSGATIRDFIYDNNEPWPNEADGDGFSLVLNNPRTNPNHALASSWRASSIPGGTPGVAKSAVFTGSPGDDTDGDGFPDFLEFATGSDFSSNASRHTPALALTTYTVGGVPGTYLQFTFRRGLNADGFTLSPELTTDFANWNGPVTFVRTTNNGDGTTTHEYRSTQPTSVLGSKAAMRVRVTPVP
jgi:CotH kinase protein/Lamin Tail Domain/Fn3 associated